MWKRITLVIFAALMLWLVIVQTEMLWAQTSTPVMYDTSLVQTGDLLFLKSKTWRSYVVLLLDRNHSDFSHVGLISVKEGVPYLIHASPTSSAGETGGVVQIERLARVLSSNSVERAALIRLKDEYKHFATAAIVTAENYADLALPFDHDFSLLSADRLYCTELVWRAYLSAGLDLFDPGSDQPTILLPSLLYQNRHFTRIDPF